MKQYHQFYINGQWVEPISARTLEVINPATEQPFASISMGSAADVDAAVIAARAAFPSWSQTSPEQRLDILQKVAGVYEKHSDAIAEAISNEMGSPITLAKQAHGPVGSLHWNCAINTLKKFAFEHDRGTTRIIKEPIGVCGLITPWNWPINQIVSKVAPALATGCTMVIKPSEIAPINAYLLAKVFDEAGLPPGVFNLINGDGATVGSSISSHPGIDMVSFTGSTRAGIEVAKAAAQTVKRVTQELGGKSANILLDDADFEQAVTRDVQHCFLNSGQSCNAPTRMLVPADKMDKVIDIARRAAENITVDDPRLATTVMGPVVGEQQYQKIQTLIELGINEGATLVCGGLGKPDHLSTGYYVKPTVFANVSNTMTIAREEIFGPVLSIIPYRSDSEAIEIANDTLFGLASYITSSNLPRARDLAKQMRSGQVTINGAGYDLAAPFGGYKQSGNGREHGEDYAFDDYLETKAVLGYGEN
jgi:aldehyde dehydrogenase (NAD+)